MLRIRAESSVTRGRAAIIKAYYLKNPHSDCPKEVLTVSLNEASNNPAYILGRLFSVYEAVQQSANPGINTTIKDKYLTAACETPPVVFPTLLKLAEKHLRKLDGGLKWIREKQLHELTGKITESFPKHLNMEDQGIFMLGYYHQTQARYTKKEN